MTSKSDATEICVVESDIMITKTPIPGVFAYQIVFMRRVQNLNR